MRDITEIALALITLATVGVIIVNGQNTATAATGIGNAFAGLIRAASFQGAGVGFGSGM
jgi:hypothetical protein